MLSTAAAVAARLIVYFMKGFSSTPSALAIYYLSIGLVAGTELSTRSCLSIGEFSKV